MPASAPQNRPLKLKYLSFTSFNLYNLNEPERPMYGRRGWTNKQYEKKIDWTSRNLKILKAEVFGFQELWHEKSLKNCFAKAGLSDEYQLLIPNGQSGQRIVCAGAVLKDILVGEPEWIVDFPPQTRLESSGDDPQTPEISVSIDSFSRPVLHFTIAPRSDEEPIHVYVCHFKSKGPTKVYKEDWYKSNKKKYKDHATALGSALSTIRRTAEATALRIIITERTKGTDTPVVVLGDLNDGVHSNTLNILTGQPRFLPGLATGGGDFDLYTAQIMQNYRSERDVYYTHEYQNMRESLDQILFSQEFYDNARKRIWEFRGLTVNNDHLNFENHKESGTNDHGIIRASFKHKPAKRIIKKNLVA